MAYNHGLYIRRCSELGIDPEYRVGKLTYVCKLLSNLHSGVCGALMLCDCGKFTKIGLPSLYRGGEALPFECETCVKEGKNKSKSQKRRGRESHKQAEKAKKKRIKELGFKARGLTQRCRAEYHCWHNCIHVAKNEVDPRWRGRGGFLRFMEDMGTRPWPKSRFLRKDPAFPFSKENAYWSKPQQSKPKQPNPQ